jgi:hypothetical protein
MKTVPSIPVRVLRQAALDAGVHEKTAVKVALGLPVRPAGKERVLEALRARGVNVSALPIFRRADETGYGE